MGTMEEIFWFSGVSELYKELRIVKVKSPVYTGLLLLLVIPQQGIDQDEPELDH